MAQPSKQGQAGSRAGVSGIGGFYAVLLKFAPDGTLLAQAGYAAGEVADALGVAVRTLGFPEGVVTDPAGSAEFAGASDAAVLRVLP